MTAWDELEVILYRIYEEPISSIEEKVLGIVERKLIEGALLRNWLNANHFMLQSTAFMR